MPKIASDALRSMMDNPKQVRNMLMTGSSGNGKSCAVDCLGVYSNLLSEDKIGEALISHCRQDEREKACTYKCSVNTMAVAEDLLVSVVDTPGHVDFSAELSIAMPLCDGALVVVNGSTGDVAPFTCRIIRELVSWIIEPICFINRLDVSFLVTKKSASEILFDLQQCVDGFNAAIQAATCPTDKPPSAVPESGNVLFGSLSQGWAFTIPQLASTYAAKFKIDVEKMAGNMWGERYFNPKTKKWSSSQSEGAQHGLVQFALQPMLSVMAACEAGDMAKIEKMLTAVGATFTSAQLKTDPKHLFKRVMQLWMPAGKCLAGAFRTFVPDPVSAQNKRAQVLINAPTTDASAIAVKECSPSGKLMLQAVKLQPQSQTPGRFYALGRVFSGTATADKCFMVDDDYIPAHAKQGTEPEAPKEAPKEEAAADAPAEEDAEDAEGGEGAAEAKDVPKIAAKQASTARDCRIQSVNMCAGKGATAVPSIPAGNICLLGGVDQLIVKRTSLVWSQDCFPLAAPRFIVSPVVRMSVQPKEMKELPKVVEALKRLGKSCPLVEIKLEDSGSHVVAGVGEEHMRVLQRDLGDYGSGIKVVWGVPSVAYRETVTTTSSQTCLSKSPNKHNRLFVQATPLDEECNRAIEAGRIFPDQDLKQRTKLLTKEFDWVKEEALKIWGFGPAPETAGEAYGANVVVDMTKGIQYLLEIKESVNTGLLWSAKQGPICEEQMRGIRYNLLDCRLHTDSIHRGTGQIMPTARRVFYASMMTGMCRLVEPVFAAAIDATTADVSTGVMQALNLCRGELISSDEKGNTLSVQAYMPVAETIGQTPFATVLSQKTNGKAAVNYVFDHWEVVVSDPLDCEAKTYKPKTKAAEIMMAIRKRKGLKVEPPILTEYLDKL